MSAPKKDARDFLDHAVAFQTAAERLVPTRPFLFHPSFYLVLHSIELGLKAHLRLAGISVSSLRSRALGHNLGALVAVAHEIDAVPFLDAHARRALTFGGKSYSRKAFEYPEQLGASTLPIGRWLQLAKLITRNAEKRLSA